MNKIYPLLLLLLVTFISCTSSGESGEEGESGVATDSLALEAKIDTIKSIVSQQDRFDFSQNFARTYAGTIGEIPVHMNLIKVGEKLSGTYYYDKVGKPIGINEGKVNQKGYFSFKEHDFAYEETGFFIGQLKGNKIEAVWQSPDRAKKLAVSLVSNADGKGANNLSLQVFHESTTGFYIANDTTSPRYTFIYTALFPSSDYDGPAEDELYRQMEALFGEFKEVNNPKRSIEAVYQASFKEYKESIKDFAGEEDMAYALNWSSITEMEVIYNDRGVFSIASDFFSYSGGAHGNFARGINSYEIATGKQIMLADLFSKNYKDPLSHLIVAAVKEQQGLSPRESLNDVGFYEESLVPTNNFYITHQGIGFYYSPYEVAPYAAGATEVFIPFKLCSSFLRTDGIVSKLSL